MKQFASRMAVLSLLLSCSSGDVSPGTTGGGASGGSGTDLGLGGKSGGGTGGTSGGTGGTGPTDDKNCGQQKYDLKRLPAELLLVLDHSGSMKDDIGGGTRKWDALVPAVDQVIMASTGGIYWGLKSFPSGTVRCAVDNTVMPDLDINNYPQMSAAIKGLSPDGQGTPTRLAVDAAKAHLATRTTPNPKFIALATDGEPNCLANSTNNMDNAGAVQAIANAAAAGFNTFVIGIATKGSATLDQMAVAGGQARPGTPKYYDVNSQADLVNALTEITGKISTCTFPLTTAPPVPDNVAVNIGGTRIMKDATHMNGWDYGAGMKSIQLYGPACDSVMKTADKLVDIIYGCPGKIIE